MAGILDKNFDAVIRIGTIYNVQCTMLDINNARKYIPALNEITGQEFVEQMAEQLENIELNCNNPWPQIKRHVTTIVEGEYVPSMRDVEVMDMSSNKMCRGKRLSIHSKNQRSIIYITLSKR